MLVDGYLRRINNKKSVEYSQINTSIPQYLQGYSEDELKNNALKISAVYSCVNVLSNSISKLPFFVVNTTNNKHLDSHVFSHIFQIRPNENMILATFHKLMETWRLIYGNAYAYIDRGIDGNINSLIPLHPQNVTIKVNNGIITYEVLIGTQLKTFMRDELLHLKGFSYDGIRGISVLEFASSVIKTGLYQEKYQASFYEKGDRPSGVLATATDITGQTTATGESYKDKMRNEWERAHSGADNAFRVAILDNGLSYQAIPPLNLQDAQFVASKELSVADIARFFCVPLYKIAAGKESYSSNEQNSIEYIVNGLSPILTTYEQEYSSKCLFEKELKKGIRIKANLNVELRGDIANRGAWYKTMREVGAYSVNDIRGYEDMESVEGGDSRLASLNYVPLNKFEELSLNRNATNSKTSENEQKDYKKT